MSVALAAAGLEPDPAMLAVAVLADVALGDPPNAVHPVAWMGRLANMLLRWAPRVGPGRQLAAGALIVSLVVGISAVAVIALVGWGQAVAPALTFWIGAALL